MSSTKLQGIALSIAGVTALAIGAMILFAPRAFYASYGIALGPNPNLLSELRAPGAGIAVLGSTMLAGLVRERWVPFAIAAATTIYLAFPLGRLVGIVVDGVPNISVLGALAIEVAIGALCVIAFARPRRPRQAVA